MGIERQPGAAAPATRQSRITMDTIELAPDDWLTIMDHEGLIRFDMDARLYLLGFGIGKLAIHAMDVPDHRERLVSGLDLVVGLESDRWGMPTNWPR
jgi:hypothetical protein